MKQGTKSFGFTLIELLIAIALLAIVGSLAVPSFQLMVANQGVSNSASDLMTDVMQARSIAMAKNKQSVMESVSGDWAKGWTIYLDNNANGSFDSNTDTLVITREAIRRPTIVDTDTTITTGQSIPFQPNGFSAGTANITVGIKSNDSTRKRRIIVSRSGRPRICDPDRETCS
jgi:type IV fimbrial biogenesis protein FimT